ncbi:TolC family protein [Nitrospira sp. Kam-Ns4a]
MEAAKALGQPATLRDLIRLALERNPRIAAARHGLQVAAKGIDAAKGQQYGRLEFRSEDFTWGPLNNKLPMQSLVIDQARLVQQSPGVAAFNRNLFSFGGTLTIPIYTGGRLTNQIRLEEIAERLAADRLAQTRDDLIFNVSSTYYTILQIKEFIKATEKSVERLEESKRVVEARLKADKATPADVFKINTRLAAVRQELIRANNALALAYGALNTLLGDDAVAPPPRIEERLAYQAVPLDLSKSVEDAMARRPDLQAKQKEVEIQEKRIQIALAEALPQVAFNGMARGVMGEESKLFDQQFGGISLSVPLFAGGTIRAKVTQERARLLQLQEELAQLKLEVTQSVQSTYLRIVEAEKRITVAEAARAEAQEVLRVEQLKVEVGKGVIENLLDAQAAMLQAEQSYAAALADANTARVALAKAVGVMETPN